MTMQKTPKYTLFICEKDVAKGCTQERDALTGSNLKINKKQP